MRKINEIIEKDVEGEGENVENEEWEDVEEKEWNDQNEDDIDVEQREADELNVES